MKLTIPRPVSAGVFLSYMCSSECRHCMYACSPRWRADWIGEKDLERILTQLSETIQPSRLGARYVGLNHGLHFTGGEPFLNFELLVRAVEKAHELRIPSIFVETNSFWCFNDRQTRDRLERLRNAGLHGLLVSVNPFILEEVPFERTERAINFGRKVFGSNAMVYQETFLNQFRSHQLKGTLQFERYLQLFGPDGFSRAELLPLGRANYELAEFYEKHPADEFFGVKCVESLTRQWHVHVDNYGNYLPGYCGGISLGDARELSSVCTERDLEGLRVLGALATGLGELYKLARDDFGYSPLADGYVSGCHLCLDIRRHLVHETDQFEELEPKEFYAQLHSGRSNSVESC